MGTGIAQIAPNEFSTTSTSWADGMIGQIKEQVKEAEYLLYRLSPVFPDLISLLRAKKLNLIQYFAAAEAENLVVLFVVNDGDKNTEMELYSILGELYCKYDSNNVLFEFLVYEKSDGLIPPSHFIELPN